MQYDSKRIDGGRQLMKIDEFKKKLSNYGITHYLKLESLRGGGDE